MMAPLWDNVVLELSQDLWPFAFFIGITLLFSTPLAWWLDHSIKSSLPATIPNKDDYVDYALDGSIRLSALMTVLGAMPYAIWRILHNNLPTCWTFAGILVLVTLFSAMFVALALIHPPQLRTKSFWFQWRWGTWSVIILVALNIMLALGTGVRVLPD